MPSDTPVKGPAVRIPKWDDFQHYKDRTPPWIKLHRSLLNNREWRSLDPFASKLLVELWLLASEGDIDGVVQLGTEDIAWRLRYDPRDTASVALALQTLERYGFVALVDHDTSAVLADCKQPATPETEAEGETEAPVSSRWSETGAPPRVEHSTDDEPDEPDTPDDSDTDMVGSMPAADFNAAFIPAVRDHWWCGDSPPPNSSPGWDEGREASIAKTWVGQDLCTAAEAIRLAETDPEHFGLSPPCTLAVLNSRTNRGTLSEVLGMLRKGEPAPEPRDDDEGPQRMDAMSAIPGGPRAA